VALIASSLVIAYVLSANSSQAEPTEQPPPWMRADGTIDYSKVPERIELLVPGGDRAGYIDSEVVFDQGAPELIERGEPEPESFGDGPFPVYAARSGNKVVGQYYRSLGFVTQETYESPDFDAQDARGLLNPPTTT